MFLEQNSWPHFFLKQNPRQEGAVLKAALFFWWEGGTWGGWQLFLRLLPLFGRFRTLSTGWCSNRVMDGKDVYCFFF